MTQWIARDANGYALSVVMPHGAVFVVANHTYGGYPVLFATRESAQADVELRNAPRVVRWERVEVAQ